MIQRLLLIGVRLEMPPAIAGSAPPAVLRSLIDAVEPARSTYDRQALSFGNRYRSGFWAIYLLSAVAVLCAVLPLGLGWDDSRHALHPFVGVWAVMEVVIICAVASIYWLGHRRDWQGQWLRARTTAELIGYLPMLAPIVDFDHGSADADWYLRVSTCAKRRTSPPCVSGSSRWRASGSPTHGAIPRSCQATRAGPSRCSTDSAATIIGLHSARRRCSGGCTV